MVEKTSVKLVRNSLYVFRIEVGFIYISALVSCNIASNSQSEFVFNFI